MAEDTSKIPIRRLHRRCARGDHWKAFAKKSISCSMTLALACGARRSATPFFDMDPFRRAKAAFSGLPAVDVTETEKGYKVVAELPGMDEKNIEVKIANGMLTIKGERQSRYV